MDVAAAERLGVDYFAGCRFHEWRSAQEDRALVANDYRLVTHGGDVGAACRARTEYRGDLRDTLRGHPCLVVENATEVIAIREHLVLPRQECAPGIDQVDAGQAVLPGDLLGAQMFLDRQRIIGPAFHRRVVGDDHAVDVAYLTNARDDARGGDFVVVQAICRELTDLQERRTLVDQFPDAVARQQFAALQVFLPRPLAAALGNFRLYLAQRFGQLSIGRRVFLEVG